jgi:hypothetical protein
MEILADPQNIDESQYRGWTGEDNSSSLDRASVLHLLQDQGVLDNFINDSLSNNTPSEAIDSAFQKFVNSPGR